MLSRVLLPGVQARTLQIRLLQSPRQTRPPENGPHPSPANRSLTNGSGVGEASPAASRNNSAGNIGLGHAVLAAAQELAHHCQVPGISEAASVVCIMANLVTDSRDVSSGSESRLRQCRSIVVVLKRAEKVVDLVR